MNPEIQAKLILFRQKCIDKSITQEEIKEAIAILRGERSAAAQQTKANRAKAAKAAIPSADDLLGELGDL